jgi:hypothetical protein
MATSLGAVLPKVADSPWFHEFWIVSQTVV